MAPLLSDCFNVFDACEMKSCLLLTAGKAKSQQLSSGMRRTVSLDAIIGPYLQGHWPKEPEGQGSLSRKDKATQVRSKCGKLWKCLINEWNALRCYCCFHGEKLYSETKS